MVNIIKKGFRKICRSLVKNAFLPNSIRVFLLKMTGVTIGSQVIINEGFTLACDIGYEENLIIEDRVAFGPNVTIIITSHPNHSLLRELHSIYPHFEVFGNVRIKHDSWIGAGSIILPDTCINESSLVGAGSVVTKDVPSFCVVAGNPAKIIREISTARKN
ncbi:acyltransferase [Methanoregula sp.]|uniref:acyltransferase n=1 Tax=Methanoregula sp. TaxID=2052170 RepID=UPI002603A936|nr:acyltransferase [Methanoregula sp.]MDD5141896.1 acyltransferase [Methanoregula sp.]